MMKKQIFLLTIIGLLFSCSQKNESENLKTNSDSSSVSAEVKKELPGQSEITCPKCGFKKTETMPTDVCLLKYTCTGCRAELEPKEGDCCVFCTYGTKKCPSKQ